MIDRDMIDSAMKDRMIDNMIDTVMTDRVIIIMSIETIVTDIMIDRVTDPEGLLMILRKGEDIDREEMSLAEDPIETSPGTFLGIDIDTEDSLREAAAQRVEGEATRMMKIRRPAMVKGGSERVAQSP